MPFKENTKAYKINSIEKNIIIGSLLGDGSLALYGRSKNAYYREHGCTKQIQYRKWKAERLKNLAGDSHHSESLALTCLPSLLRL